MLGAFGDDCVIDTINVGSAIIEDCYRFCVMNSKIFDEV